MELDDKSLLSMKLVESRDYIKTKKKVDDEILYKYEEYIYKCHDICPPSVTQKFEVRYESFTKQFSDKIGDYVQRKLDLRKEADEFYSELTDAMNTLTKDELFYFKFYLRGVSEEKICERLNTNKCSLKRIKMSAIIKIAMYFDIDVLATN
jgi:hypothetical protein